MMARTPRPKKAPPGADPLLWHTLQMAASALRGAEAAALDAAADAKARGMSPDHIAAGLEIPRSTLYRKMVDRW